MENNITPQTRVMRELPPEWRRLIELCERMRFGDMTISVVNGKPILVKNLLQNIKLDNPDDFKTVIL